MNEEAIETLDEVGRWRARDVTYFSGRWDQVRRQIPRFETTEFRASPDAPPNPYMKAVVRIPRTQFEQVIPVGTVSNAYTLAQHEEVASKCLTGMKEAGIGMDRLRCEVGLTQLGEWMNLRIYFPEEFNHTPLDGKSLGLRLECFNSVDGSSRLVILLGWLRFVCSNGLVIGETKAELRDIHNKHMDLDKIPGIVRESLELVKDDLERIASWESRQVRSDVVKAWADKILGTEWNKKAACRVYHICTSGSDVDIADPFAPGEATDKPVKLLQAVPGAPVPAKNLYDVSQALSWVASRRNSTEEKVDWQSAIPGLIHRLGVIG